MDSNEWISKKDLLKITGISYGQLYRWKRQHLIPESWFVKQSSFTGQETFFPREQMLERVRTIQELKDRYSLEELGELFSPSLDKRSYELSLIRSIPELDSHLTDKFAHYLMKREFLFIELLFVLLANRLTWQCSLSEGDQERLIRSAKDWIPQLTGSEYEVRAYSHNGRVFFTMLKQGAGVWFGENVHLLAAVPLDELIKELHGIIHLRVGEMKG
ncbi:DUF4004 family protein [Paenibacillus senegalensis]|uniref:DUF4004 family protein n=1 Tax=Paenibacillus senegalensis TaxID=1465766 RepID=UPI0002895373|nr:DUF4004 family protein [Paenibacillus senegalensis]